MPGAVIFSLITGAKLFTKRQNPFNKLGMLNTLNQMLYLLIVMWSFSQKPDAMLMLFAMVFGAHLLPFSWLYESKTYLVTSRRDDHIHFCSRDLCWHLHDRLPGRYVCTAYDRMQET